MTREEKIAAIYKEMANTEIELGCKIKTYGETGVIIKYQGNKVYVWWDRGSFEVFDNYQLLSIKYGFGVIGHPVMIGDIIKRIKEKREISYGEFLVKLLGQLRYAGYWKNLEASIEDQSDECIDYVYSLIQKD